MDSFTSRQWAAFASLVDQWEAASPAERHKLLAGIADPKVAEMFRLLSAWPDRSVDSLKGLPLRENLKVGERLGVGGMGAVYAGKRHVGPVVQDVAVKFVRPEVLQAGGALEKEHRRRFQGEVERLLQLKHRYIVEVLDAGEVKVSADGPGIPWFAMKQLKGDVSLVRMPGETATNADARDPLLGTLDKKLEVYEKLLEAMAHAHRQEVLHLDLSPNNVRVSAGPEPRVIDFGLSAIRDVLHPDTLHLVGAGTPGYQAPEQIHPGHGDIGPWTDVHALGVLGFQLLVKELPFAVPKGIGDEFAALAAAIGSPHRERFTALLERMGPDSQRALARFGPALDAACMPDPGKRPRDADEMLQAWRAAKAGGADGGRPAHPPSDPKVPTVGPGATVQIVGAGGVAINRSFNRSVHASNGGIAIGGNVTGSEISTGGRVRRK
jgi:serine/threonine protein kinase